MGIDVAGESQLVGYPTQFPSVSMVDWTTGAPNARFGVLQLLKNNFAPEDKIVESASGTPYVVSFAVIKPNGARKLLLINKRDRTFNLTVPSDPARVSVVDQTSKGVPETLPLSGKTIQLRGLAVAVIDFK
jgi:hypothetical protein